MTGKLAGKRIAIIVANEFEDVELMYPLLRLSEEGATILLAPVPMGAHPRPYLENKPVTGRFGTPVPIPFMREGNRYHLCRVEDLAADQLDGLLFPGGFSPDMLRRHPRTLELTRECHNRHKIIAAICHGPWVLISAGIVKGKRLTGFAAVRDDLINAGAEYVDVPALRDGNLVTGRVPDDLPEFCQKIIRALSE